MQGPKEKWLSIIEYSHFKKISVSTIRRYIKANRVKYKLEDGKYYIFCPNYVDETQLIDEDLQLIDELTRENTQLKSVNRSLKEEVHEMKMLIDLYEAQLGIKEPKTETGKL